MLDWIDDIFSIVWDIGDWFYNLYIASLEWWLVGEPVSTIFYRFSVLFHNLCVPIAQFYDWAYDVLESIGDILSLNDILAYFSDWMDWAQWAWEWIEDAYYYVTDIVDDWWSGTALTVQGWIDAARDYAEDLVADVTNWLTNLQASWDAFKGKIPTIDEVIAWWSNWQGYVLQYINTWWTGAVGEVQDLIDSAFTIREGLWDGWQDWRDQVAEFFSDPVEFLWAKFTDWFLGPEG